MNPPPAKLTSSQVLQYLESAGAKLFVRAVYANPELFQLLDDNQIRLILVPSDRAVTEFLNLTNRTVGDLSALQLGRDIIANHFSLDDNLTVDHYYAANGEYIPLNPQALTSYRITAKGQLGQYYLVLMDGFIIKEPQRLRWVAERSPGLKTALGGGQVGNEGLKILIAKGDIRGKDLVFLCNTNFEVYDFCNSRDKYGNTIFHRFLQEEFGLEVPPYEDAKEVYISQLTAGNLYKIEDTYREGHSVLLGQTAGGKPIWGEKLTDELYTEILGLGIVVYAITPEGELVAISRRKWSREKEIEIFRQEDIEGVAEEDRFWKLVASGRFITREGRVIEGQDFEEAMLLDTTPPGQRVLTASRKGRIVFEDVATGMRSLRPSFELLSPKDARTIVGASPEGRYIFHQTETPAPSYWIQDFSLREPRIINLEGFPGGDFTHSPDKITVLQTDTTMVVVLNRRGELWIAHDIYNRPNEWVQFQNPAIGKITQFIAYADSQVTPFDPTRGYIPTFYDPRSPEVPVTYTTTYTIKARALNDKGQHFSLYLSRPELPHDITLNYQIPGLLGYTNYGALYDTNPGGVVLVRSPGSS